MPRMLADLPRVHRITVRTVLAATVVAVAAPWGCSRNVRAPDASHPAVAVAPSRTTADAGTADAANSAASKARDRRAWRTAYDWDGDGEVDEVDDKFSGGAHCCYTVGVRLSSRKRMVWLPFEMDGGYAYPMDLPDLPERFSIGRTPEGLPEMRMEIGTYSGDRPPLPASWRSRYGIRSHHIAVSFPRGRVRVRDLPRR